MTLNPWWTVPQSIIRELGSMRGYEVRRNGNQLTVRQPPGPRNSLGRLKIEMPNEHAIFLHDTPAQALFSRPVRAFSHGCVRTQNIRDFAAVLLAPTGQWDRAAIDAASADVRLSTETSISGGSAQTCADDRPRNPAYTEYTPREGNPHVRDDC